MVEENAKTDDAKSKDGKRILLVDDDNEIIESMRMALESRGYRILVARDRLRSQPSTHCGSAMR